MGNTYNVIDLFCGCGGFSKGFEQAGFRIRFGIDVWSDATATYKYNFPEAVTLNEDITTVTGEDIVQYIGISKNEADVIIGGPPCQGFSVSGKRLIDDPRNILYKSYVRLVGELKPKAFILENVPGIVRLFGGKVKDEIIDDFNTVGYNVEYKILLASEYGIPQIRKRVFFVGLNKDILGAKKFIFPEPTHGDMKFLSPLVTSKDAIGDLPLLDENVPIAGPQSYSSPPKNAYQKLMRGDLDLVFNHEPTIHKQRTREIIAMVPDGGNYKVLPKELWDTRKVHIAWTRMNSQVPCFTIDTGHNHHFHYEANRVPTCRESARIQTFPDSFIVLGNRTSQLKQIGNAVPPLLAEIIAEKLKEYLL